MPEKSFLPEFDDSAKYRLDLMPVQIIANNENFLEGQESCEVTTFGLFHFFVIHKETLRLSSNVRLYITLI